MLGILIVDDEDIICEGLSLLVKSHGYSLLGTASNGKEALEKILTLKPDIVITDIRMPVMDGLELVKTCSDKNIPANFILLTGYGEFEYAHKAMSYGVKHYILKPADESEILHALDDISCSVMQRENQSRMVESLRQKIRQMAPQAMEEFLAEWIQNGRCAESDLTFFQGLFSQESAPCCLLLMKPENTDDYVIRFELKYISRELLEPLGAYANTTVENIIVIVTSLTDPKKLLAQVETIRIDYKKFIGSSLAVSISKAAEFREIPKLFSEAKQGFQYRFYLEPDAIIRPSLLKVLEQGAARENGGDFNYSIDEMSITAGNYESINAEINHFFDALESAKLTVDDAKNQILQFYLILKRALHGGSQAVSMEQIKCIFQMETLSNIRLKFLETAKQINEERVRWNDTLQAKLAQHMKELVGANIDNPKLSLKWIAKNELYMNEDYLSKIFVQNTSERFSHYVMRLRVEKAKKLIQADSDIKICDISRQCGFDMNTAYFCTAFKNAVGQTPTEYKKKVHGLC